MLTEELKYEILYQLSNAQIIDTDDRQDTLKLIIPLLVERSGSDRGKWQWK